MSGKAWCVFCAGILMFGAFGCATTPPPSGPSPTGSATPVVGADAGTGTPPASDQGGGTFPIVSGSGACLSPSDTAALTGCYGDGSQDITDIAADCAIQVCLTVPMEQQSSCMDSCIVQRTGGAITTACANCVTQTVGCVQQHCLSPCLSDPSSAACIDCQCGNNTAGVSCREINNQCSGVIDDTCTGGSGPVCPA